MQLILIRHAETAWNRDNKFLGATDVELTDEGIQQAWMAAGAVAELKPDYLISSPLLRARMTAGAIAEKAGLCPSTMEELTEINLGDLEGLEGRDMKEQYPDLLAQWRSDPSPVCFPRWGVDGRTADPRDKHHRELRAKLRREDRGRGKP